MKRVGAAPLAFDAEIAVIGAGVSGLSAAAALRFVGKSVALLEASGRVGGRAWTDRPAVLDRVAFDHGAQWLHGAPENPLIPILQGAGETVGPGIPSEGGRRILDGEGRPQSVTEYETAEQRWNQAVRSHLGGNDLTLAEATQAIAGDRWTATIETWEGAIIAAADATVLSLQDWAANALEGENWVVPDGLGAAIGRAFAIVASPARLNTAVTAIEATPAGVILRTSRGDLRAKAAIVTVSTGVLRAGNIRFTPALPAATLAALDGLPMGLLTKVALRASGADRLDLPAGTDAFRLVECRGAAAAPVLFWPGGDAIAVGFVGGQAAWDFCHAPNHAADFVREELRRMFGPRGSAAFAPESLVTDWGSDPNFLGSYAYATPGNTAARRRLAEPLWEGRLVFAGEACAPNGLAGTVGGAWCSGRDAARNFLATES